MALLAPRPCALISLVLVTSACTDREPLDSATLGGTGEASGSTGGSTGEPPIEPPPVPGTSSTSTSTTTVPTSTTALDTGDPTLPDTTTGDLPEQSGRYLLAVSTVIAPDLPVQFLASTTWTGQGGQLLLRTELQPLALDQGQVTSPRTPVGEPLVFEAIVVEDGVFVLDLGEVFVSGAANPITGADIVAALTMTSAVFTADFYCGAITGDLLIPLMSSLDGSTFAAVRVDDPNDLPLAVTINCAGDTVAGP